MSKGAAWRCRGGDLRAAVERLAAARAPGALLRVEAERRSIERARADGLDREAEGRLLLRAWRGVERIVPPESVGHRTGWSRLEWVVAGEREPLAALGRRILAWLSLDDELGAVRWHVVMTAIVAEEPQRTLSCDPGYEMAAVERRSALAWVIPYDGPDWREPQRYPTVHWIATEETSPIGETASVRDQLAEMRRMLTRFVEASQARCGEGWTRGHVDELTTILLDVARRARDALRLEVAPSEPPPRRGLLARAAREGLVDPSLASRIEDWLARGHVAPGPLDDPAAIQQELVPPAIDFALLARSVELGRMLEPDEARSVVEQMRGELAPRTPAEARAVASFRAAGRSVCLQRSTSTGLARVLVDGCPVAMTFSRTRHSTTNAGSYERVLGPAHEAAWFDLDPFDQETFDFEVSEIASGFRAVFRVGGRVGEIYNTAIYESAWITLELPRTLDRAIVAIDVHSDTSS